MTATAAHAHFETPRRTRLGARRIRTLPIRLPRGYPFAAVTAFLVLLSCLVAVRAELPDQALRDMPWLLAVAVIPVLPWLVPLLARHMSGVRAGPLQIDFRTTDQVKPPMNDVEDIAMKLAGVSTADMPTRSEDIVKRAREIEARRIEVVVVNLGGGRWQLAPLYFVAFLLESRTIVRRLVLVESGREGERKFVGMCSPRALRRSIEREYPLLRDVRKETPIVDLGLAGAFFDALVTAARGRSEAEYSPTVDAGHIVEIVGTALEREPIERHELDGLPAERRLLSSERRYVAVVDGGRYDGVLDQYRVALEIARRATDA